jgi:ankyrin repeat protein
MLKNHFVKELSPEYERLYQAAACGDFHTLRKCLQNGIPVNFINPITTDSPLMIASRKGHSELVRLCLDYGAKNDPHPEFGQTALHAAVTSNQYDCAKILLDIAAASDADYIIANLTDQHSQTPLHSAVLIGSTELTELLLQHGSKISAVDAYGQTPLHITCGSSSEECLAVLLDHGGDDLLESVDIYGNTSLHHAAYNGNANCVKLLLETAANVDAKNLKGLTAYNLATMQGHHAIGVLLLEYKELHNTPALSNHRPAISQPFKQPKVISSTINNLPQTPFSPPYHSSVVSSPSLSKFDESEYRTPLQFSEKKNNSHNFSNSTIGSSSNSNSAKYSSSSLSITNPIQLHDIRRSKASGSMENIDTGGSTLPRPHTIGSPALNPNKNGKKNNFVSSSSHSSSSSPVETHRRQYISSVDSTSHSNNNGISINPIYIKSKDEDTLMIESRFSPAKPLTQLATPLLSRETTRNR